MTEKSITQELRKTEKIIKEIELDNQQRVKIFDLSRKISVDAYLVSMAVKMEVAVDESLFSDAELAVTPFDEIVKTVGSHVVFEYTDERNFIMAENKDAVLNELVDKILENMIGYLSKESFPAKLVFKKYRDMKKRLPF